MAFWGTRGNNVRQVAFESVIKQLTFVPAWPGNQSQVLRCTGPVYSTSDFFLCNPQKEYPPLYISKLILDLARNVLGDSFAMLYVT